MIESKDIIIKEYEGKIKYLQFKKLLEYNIKHAYTLSMTGIDFSFNTKEHDDSYKLLAEALEISENIIVEPLQTHTDEIVVIDKVTTSDVLVNVDGLITNKENIAITSKNADCILFMLFDPKKRVIANVHSGWKGTFKKIVIKTVLKMIEEFGCNTEDILCFISPSIRKCHFEVDEDVKNMCEEIFNDFDLTNVIENGEIKEGKQKYMIDTVLINKIGLEKIGIKKENIIDSNICSVCNKDIVHSARAEGEGFKRETAIIML